MKRILELLIPVAAIGVVIGFALGIAFALPTKKYAPHPEYRYGQHVPQYEEDAEDSSVIGLGDVPTWLQSISGVILGAIVAWFSYRLWQVSRDQKVLLAKSIELTMRSVDAYINKERGRLIVTMCGFDKVEAVINEDGETEDQWQLWCGFHHLGDTPLIITGRNASAHSWLTHGPNGTVSLPAPLAQPTKRDLHEVVRKEGYYSFRVPEIAPSTEVDPFLRSISDVVVQVCIRYDTGMGEFLMRVCCIIEHDRDTGEDSFRIHHDDRYTDDQPVRKA